MRVPPLLLALALVGCAGAPDDRYARLKPYIGQSMTAFMRSTGLTPSDSYDTTTGKTFIVNGPAMAVAVSPGLTVAGGCKMQIDTVATSTRSTADDWRIVTIDAQGPC